MTEAHKIRTFNSGATRDTDEGKLDFEAALSPIVMERFVLYMSKNRLQPNDVVRECDNWQGLFGPKHLNVCLKSAMRHLWAWWKAHRGYKVKDGLEDAVCGVIFNAMAYLFKILSDKAERDMDIAGQAQNDSSIEAGLAKGDGSKAASAKAGLNKKLSIDELAPMCAKCIRQMKWNVAIGCYNCFKCDGHNQSTPLVREGSE